MMRRLRTAVDRGLEVVLVVLMGGMVLNVLWQVFTRYVLGSPSSVTEELARFLLIWVGLLGACYALGRGLHLGVDVVIQKLPARGAGVARRLATLTVAGFAVAVMMVGGLNLVRLTLLLEQRSAALAVPLGYVYLALPVSGLLVLVYSVAALVDPEAEPATGPHASPEASER